MHLRPHLGSAGSPEDPESVATAPLRSNSYPSLPTQPHLRPGMEMDQYARPPPRQTTFPPDRTSIAGHAPSSAYHFPQQQQQQHYQQQQQQQQLHNLDHTQAHRRFQFNHSPMPPPSSSSSSSPSSQRDHQQYHIPPSFSHSHPYPTSLSERQQQQRRRVQSMSSSTHYKEQGQDQANTFVQDQNYTHQNRYPQPIDDNSTQQQHLQLQQQQQHRHHHHNTPLRDQYDDDSSRLNQAYSRHTHLSTAYSSYPTEHNQHLAIQQHERYSQQQQQQQQQRRHTGSSPSHDHAQRQYSNLEKNKQQQLQQQQQHTFSSQTQEGHGPGAGLHNASQQQHALGAIGRGQDFGSTMIAQLHLQQPFRHQQPQSSQLYQHASLPSSSPPSHSANSSYSTSFSSSAQLYPPRSPSALASASTLSPSPGSSFQRHRARTLSSVSPYFSSVKSSSSYPSEVPTTALDSDAYVSSTSRQSSPEWNPRRKRGRANQLAGLGSGQGGDGHRSGNSNGSGQLTPQTTLHQRQSSQDIPMTMAIESTTALPIPAIHSSSLPSDMWMGEGVISQLSGGSSQTEENPFRPRPLERSEDRQWWSQREEPFESATGTSSIGSRSGSGTGSGSGSGPGVASAKQDGISALDIPKTYGLNKRPLILSPPVVGSDSFASIDHPFAVRSPGSASQQEYHQYQQQHQQQQHRQLAQSQERSQKGGVVGLRWIEAQEQRAAQQHQREHDQNNSNKNNNDSKTAILATSVREKLLEGEPRTSPSFSSPRRTQTLPMPHFRGQLVQPQSGDSSYQRRYYSSSQPSSRSSGSITATATSSAGMASAATTSGPSSLPTGRTSSPLAGRQTSSKPASPSPGASMRKSAGSKRLLQLADNTGNPLGAGALQDASGIVSIQLGRLLISTRQHVRSLLDSFIRLGSQGTSKDDINAVHPNLERVLLDLLNGILQSHNAFAARDNISSQEQPMTFRPTLVRSLAHLQELLSPITFSPPSANFDHNKNSTPTHGPLSSLTSSLLGSPSRSLSSSPLSPSPSLANRNSGDSTVMDTSRRHKISSRHPPSRLSTSISYYPEAMGTETEVDSDSELLESGVVGGSAKIKPDVTLRSVSTTPVDSANATRAATTTTPILIKTEGVPRRATEDSSDHLQLPLGDLDGSMAAADLYMSTIEFLSLMTAFVSVVCWLMQTRLLDTGLPTRDYSGQETSAGVTAAMEGVDMEQDGSESVHRDGCARLIEFLSHFDDLDNVLNPIKEALSRGPSGFQQQRQYDDGQKADAGLDPMDSVGLFAWHYFLFGSGQESPFEREAHAIDLSSLHSVHFDVILNELYTTHILSMTAKEHQKDHGQFYSPPGVVDFMWKRTILDRGRLLDQFVESMPFYLSINPPHAQQPDLREPLIPTALDPCLGVSTFLSCYVRLLIQEAKQDHTETIWKSETACRLLLTQICTHIWGIELDGFAFWMARCGILVALMPLVQHVESFSPPLYNHSKDHLYTYPSQQQHHQQYQQQQHRQLPRLHLFRSDTLQLTVPDGTSLKTVWERHCILQLRNPSRLQFDFIVTNPPYMIRKTGTFSAPDPEVYDWSILGASVATTTASSSAASVSATIPESSSPTPKSRSKSTVTKASKLAFEDEEGRLTPAAVDTGGDDSGSEAPATMMPGSGERLIKSLGGAGGGSESGPPQSSPRTKKTAAQARPTGSKGMMQAYGYFVWFAAQRIKPGKGVVCMITASQWLTLEFAVMLRAWLFENCLMDEFFQFEPYKVFSKVQTDSLIFKIRAIPPDLLPTTTTLQPVSLSSSRAPLPLPLGDHRTVFLRHTDHHKPLAGILQDYMAYSLADDPKTTNATSSFVGRSADSSNDLNIMVSSKTREELAAVIMAPSATPNTSNTTTAAFVAASGKGEEVASAPATYTYSFAPMMPASELTTFMLALTQDLGAICSAGTKKMNRLRAVEPLLWHRGPNTNPVYGLVVRMEYARAMFGEEMTSRWFRPALYWNGKNSPEGPPTGAGGASIAGASAATIPSKALHREGQFWQGRDRQRLSKKEGSPAESYCVPTSDPQRMYALCMVDKESVKVLRQQVEQKVEGSLALWKYLTDVRSHFQPGLASKRKVASSGKSQTIDDEGVAYCSTNQCGADVPEKIVHPINYGYFSKTQPRQRFFLDTDSLAVTNQCIYLTLNKLSSHYDAEQCPPLIYFLTLLNSTTLQFFVLHHCQYDQQGRMRLFRESMAKIPFQDRDVKNHPERIQYVAQLGSCMIELKDVLYSVVAAWRLTGSHHGSGVPPLPPSSGSAGSGRRGSTGGLTSSGPFPAASVGGSGSSTGGSGGGSSNQGLLDWIRKGGNPPPGLLSRIREQVRRMLIAQTNHRQQYNNQQQYQTPKPVAGRGNVTHGTKPATMTSSSAPPSSSVLHLNKKPRDFRTGAVMMSSSIGSGGPFFTDTDTDTNTVTDTDTDTDDTMDPWVAPRRIASTNSMGTGPVGYHQLQQLQGRGGKSQGQGQHSLARILNMPGDDDLDEEASMDEDEGALMTDNPHTMPMPIPEGSRDRCKFRSTVSSGFGHDEEFEEFGDQDKKPGTLPHTTASDTTSAMETDMDYQLTSTPNSTFNITANTASSTTTTSSSFNHQISLDTDRILQALERAETMVEMVQWAVDQYGYMLYGIRPRFQKLLELELKIVYSARVESLVGSSTPPSTAAALGEETGGEGGMHFRGGGGRGAGTENLASSLGITVWDLYRWEGDPEPMPPLLNPAPASTSTTADPSPLASSSNNGATKLETGNGGRQTLLPSYAFQVLENARSATQLLRELFEQFPALPSPSL